MRKLICFVSLVFTITSFAQSYDTKFIDEAVTTISCESFVIIPGFSKIENNISPSSFYIKSGGFQLSINGIIDKNSSTKIMISVFAKEINDNQLLVIASKDSQYVEYKIEGTGYGLYGGNLNDGDRYIINTGLRIVAKGYPSFILSIPLNIYIPRTHNYKITHCFVDGKTYLYSAEKNGKKKRSYAF